MTSVYLLLRSEERPFLLPLSFAVMGLASLTKNFTGLIPFAVTVIYLGITGRWKKYHRSNLIWAFALFFVVSFSWILTMTIMHGEPFVYMHFTNQLFYRFIGKLPSSLVHGRYVFGQQLLTMGKVILKGLYPWSLLLLPVLGWTLFQLRSWKREKRVFLLLWFWLSLAALLAMKSKYPWYLIVLYPSACIMTGAFLVYVFSKTAPLWKGGLVAAIIILGAIFLIRRDDYNPFSMTAAMLQVDTLRWNTHFRFEYLLAGGLVLTCFWFLLAGKVRRLASGLILLLLVVQAGLFVVLPLRFSDHESGIHKIALAVFEHNQGPPNTLYLWRTPKNLLQHHSDRWYFLTLPRTKFTVLEPERKELEDLLKIPGNNLFFMPEKAYQRNAEAYPHRFIGRYPVRRGRYVLIASPES